MDFGITRDNREESEGEMTGKCRCYINAKYYGRQAFKGGNMKGYIPCPIHEKEDETMTEIMETDMRNEVKNPFPECSKTCKVIELLGAGECENVCPDNSEAELKAMLKGQLDKIRKQFPESNNVALSISVSKDAHSDNDFIWFFVHVENVCSGSETIQESIDTVKVKLELKPDIVDSRD